MVIRHNLPAMNAQRQYGITTRKALSNSEKLSTGYRINRSADDAAGLAISEKMLRQIRGLSRGIRNSEEGISLCQVADGALNEVHDIVHRLNELSVQAANGTNSNSDREMLQDEVDHLLTEINRISDATTFNGLNLFGGAGAGEFIGHDSGLDAMSAAEASAKHIIEAGNADSYINSADADPDIVRAINEARAKAAAKTKPVLRGVADYAVKGYDAENYIAAPTTAIRGADGYAAPAVIDASGTAIPIARTAGNTAQGYTAAAPAPASLTASAPAARADNGNNVGDFTIYGGTAGTDYSYSNKVLTILSGAELTIKNNRTYALALNSIKIGAGVENANITLEGKYTIQNSANSVTIDNKNTKLTMASGSSLELRVGAALTMNNGASLTMASGSTLALADTAKLNMNAGARLTIASESKMTMGEGAALSLSGDGTRLTLSSGSLLKLDARATLSLDAAYIAGDASGKGTGIIMEGDAKIDMGDNAGMVLYHAAYLWIKDINSRVNMVTSAAIVGSNGAAIYTPSRKTTIIGGLRGLDVESLDEGGKPFPGSVAPRPISARAPGRRRIANRLWIQSGNDARDGLHLYLDVMNVKTLGLLGLNVTTQPDADRAVNTIDGALAYVSRMRSAIGAQQNRLEHIVLNENNIVENTTAAESRIRDVDVADGMAAFSLTNILLKAGETMMAQANTSNEGVMALLR